MRPAGGPSKRYRQVAPHTHTICSRKGMVAADIMIHYLNMKNREKFIHSIRKARDYFFAGETTTGEPSADLDREAIIGDLRLYLVQIARRIIDHLEYEHHVAQGLPRDTGLVFRFRLEDYVDELCGYFDRKGILASEMTRDVLFTGAIEVLLPPENIREQLPWRIRRKLFTTLLVRIAEQTGIPYPALTRSFYEHLTRGESVNGIARSQVIELFQEAMEELSREREAATASREEENSEAHAGTTAGGEPDAEQEPNAESGSEAESDHLWYEAGPAQQLEIPDLIRRTLAACGATDYTTLKKILSRRHFFDFVSVVIVYTIVGAAVILFSDPLLGFFADHLPITGNDFSWNIGVLIVYILLVTIRFQQFRLRSIRRRTLIRVSNAVAETMRVSYKEMDDVLYGTYGTTLRELKTVLIPKTRR